MIARRQIEREESEETERERSRCDKKETQNAEREIPRQRDRRQGG